MITSVFLKNKNSRINLYSLKPSFENHDFLLEDNWYSIIDTLEWHDYHITHLSTEQDR